ncbi:ABC transporter ATP-binding protein [Microbacterium sp. B2969]|uniref:ABC transporter ATP-binding protein n=1 Tax=Microbacterium alkaliflavum TaxID=3248839 RepID=A0ABW7Q5X0_9MICO
MPERPVLQTRSLDVHYGRGRAAKQVVFDVGFEVRAGESVGVIGETGSGKSTIARAVLGLVRPAKGSSVTVDGTDVTALSARALRAFRRSGVVQYVFQDPLRSLDPDLTVGQSIAEPLLIRGGLRRSAVDAAVRERFEQVQLDPALTGRFPAELSGGQRQRVAIARALVTDPKLLILDEPVSALDSANRVRILELLGILRSADVALIFISHDLGSVAGITDRTLVLYHGRLVEQGETAQILGAPTHPYTRLLVGSAPTLAGGSIDRESRDLLRTELVTS